jgi:cytoskeletal protein CcmA (bactofilin family)
MRYARQFLLPAFIALFTLPIVSAAAYANDERVALAGDFAEDLYVAGEDVTVNARVAGDVLAAGGQVAIGDYVSGDVAAAGGQVNIDAQVDDDVRAAGGQVRLGGRTRGDALAAGGTVWLTQDAEVGGRAWLAGGTVEVAGNVRGELRAAANEVVLSGAIDGDARVYAQTLKVLPTARITGKLDYYSPNEATIAPEAMIGALAHHPMGHSDEPGEGVKRGFTLMFYFVLAVTGIVLYLMFPHLALGAVRALGERPGACFGLGLAALFTVPAAAVLLLMTVIGLLLGLMLLGFYVLLLLAGFLLGILFLGDRLLRLLRQGDDAGTGKRLLSLIAAFLILWLAGLLPVFGGLAVFLLLVFGMGSFVLRLWRLYTKPASSARD